MLALANTSATIVSNLSFRCNDGSQQEDGKLTCSPTENSETGLDAAEVLRAELWADNLSSMSSTCRHKARAPILYYYYFKYLQLARTEYSCMAALSVETEIWGAVGRLKLSRARANSSTGLLHQHVLCLCVAPEHVMCLFSSHCDRFFLR